MKKKEVEATEKLKVMSNESIDVIWGALRDADLNGMYDEDTTMLEWAELVYSERSRRKVIE